MNPGAAVMDELSLLAGLPAPERERFLGRARRSRFARGDALLRQGASGDSVLLLTEGSVKVIVTHGARSTVVALRGPGDVIGELSVLDGSPRSAEVIAIEDGAALAISGDDFRAVVGDVPTARRRVTSVLAQRIREGTELQVESSSLDVTGRMAARVLELADRYGRADAQGAVTFEAPISRAELASWAGGSREAGARAMRALREAGWIAEEGRTIVVRDRAALARMANALT